MYTKSCVYTSETRRKNLWEVISTFLRLSSLVAKLRHTKSMKSLWDFKSSERYSLDMLSILCSSSAYFPYVSCRPKQNINWYYTVIYAYTDSIPGLEDEWNRNSPYILIRVSRVLASTLLTMQHRSLFGNGNSTWYRLALKSNSSRWLHLLPDFRSPSEYRCFSPCRSRPFRFPPNIYEREIEFKSIIVMHMY